MLKFDGTKFYSPEKSPLGWSTCTPVSFC